MVCGAESYRRVDCLNLHNNTWVSAPSMTCRRGTFKTEAVNLGGLIIVVSGDDANVAGTLEAFNPLMNTWINLPNMPRKIILVGSTSMNDTLYVTGGLDKSSGEYSDLVFSFDLQSFRWIQRQETLTSPRYGHAAASNNGCLWVAGGLLSDPSSGGYTNSVEIFDFKRSTWNLVPNMNVKRIWLRLVVVAGVLYAVGGDVDEFGHGLLPTIEKFSAECNCWKIVAEFRVHRRVYSVTSLGSQIYVFGGRDKEYSTCQDWDCFDTKTGAWESECFPQSLQTPNGSDDCQPTLVSSLLANEKKQHPDGAFRCRGLPRESFYGGQAVSTGDIQWG